jgi:AraC family transcriptional activator of pobA
MSNIFPPTPASQPSFTMESHTILNPWQYADTTVRLQDYEMIWITSGQCLLEMNLSPYQLLSGEICCLAPGQIRRLVPGEESSLIYFRLPSAFFYQLCIETRFPLITLDFHHLSRPMILSLSQGDDEDLSAIVQKMQKEVTNKHSQSHELRNGWLKLFMMYLQRQLRTTTSVNMQSRDTELTMRFLQLLAKAYAKKKMVADYARELMVTPNYLNQIVKRVSGFSASHHIQQFLIMEAKRQAVQSCRSMKEIAYDLGFDDLSHFSKFFKNKSGGNFSSFKRERMSV